MTTTVVPTISSVFDKLRAFILTIVPAGVEVVRGIDNRVPMPPGAFVLITELYRDRITTNQTRYTDPFPDPTPGSAAKDQSTRLGIQVDFYGPDSGDWAAMFSTLFRDSIGCDALAPDCQPLFADEGRMVPLVTGEEQYLRRWTITAVLQYNPVTTVAQDFAGTLTVGVINVDEAYPP